MATTKTGARGETVKLTDEDRRRIVAMRASGKTFRAIAREIGKGVDFRRVWAIVRDAGGTTGVRLGTLPAGAELRCSTCG
jgi:transposase-like protein